MEHKMFSDPEFVKAYKASEQVTGAYAEMLLRQAKLDQTPQSPVVLLDQACGTGIVAEVVHSVAAKEKLDMTCADISSGMIRAMKIRVEHHGWTDTKVILANAQDTKLPNNHFTHITMNFGPMLLPDYEASFLETRRLLKPGGTVAFSTWQLIGWYADVVEGLASNPEIPFVPTTLKELYSSLSRLPGLYDDPNWIKGLLEDHGFIDVQTNAAPIAKQIENADSFYPILSQMLGLILAGWKKEDRDKVTMDEMVAAVKQYMDTKYKGGKITWDWVAILTTARMPE